jgi:hypothetical protein
MFTIGYQGNTAVVDKNARRKYADSSTLELLEEGLFKPAFCSAIYSGSESEMEVFLARYRELTGNEKATSESLKRLYGVFEEPQHIQKVLLV